MNTTISIDTEAIAVAINRALLTQIAEKPSLRVLNLDDISLREVEDYLISTHCQEWGRFGIYDKKDRRNVAEWFIRQMVEFYEHRNGISHGNV